MKLTRAKLTYGVSAAAIFVVAVTISVVGCATSGFSENTANPVQSTGLWPQKPLLFIGQDLNSIREYTHTTDTPRPDGVVTYLSFYNLLGPGHPAYGALGQTPSGRSTGVAANWGSGPLNADALTKEYPDAALVIGLNIAEGNNQQIWAEGGLSRIGTGFYDKHIKRLAAFCRSLDRPVYLRIGYEFDGAWNKGYEQSGNYIKAWRRIVSVMRDQGAANVFFVWQASASPIDDLIDGRSEDIRHWYPGDQFVDWLAFSWFLPLDKIIGGVKSQRQLIEEVLRFARARKKPVMVAEAAPQGYDIAVLTRANISRLFDGPAGSRKQRLSAEQLWQRWFRPFFTFLGQNSDVIRAVTYISADWDKHPMWAAPYANGYWGDSRVTANAVIKQKWRSAIEALR